MSLTREDWTLLAIAAGEGRPLQPVQLQKVLFVISRELPDAVGPDFYQFHPYNYGPFCREVYQDAGVLASRGLVAITRPSRWNEYSVTVQGAEAARELREAVPARAVSYLSAIVRWAQDLSFQQLVRAIYSRYPGMLERSIFVGGQP